MKKIIVRTRTIGDHIHYDSWEMSDHTSLFVSDKALFDRNFRDRLLERGFTVSEHGVEEIYTYGQFEITIRDVRPSKNLLFSEFWWAMPEEGAEELIEVSYTGDGECLTRYCTQAEAEAEFKALEGAGYYLRSCDGVYRQYTHENYDFFASFSGCKMDDIESQIQFLDRILEEIQNCYPEAEKEERTASFKFKALYDNTIQDGPIEKEFITQNIMQADDIAYKESKREGYVEGKYNVFAELAGTWVNIDVIYAITKEV